MEWLYQIPLRFIITDDPLFIMISVISNQLYENAGHTTMLIMTNYLRDTY